MEDRGIESFEELNDFFMAWAEQVANARIHAETKEVPIERFFKEHTPTIPPPKVLSEAFRWSLVRRVQKTSTVSLLSNRYQVDPLLIGRNVELRFDPEDLSKIEVYLNGLSVGEALPFVVGRHVHPAVPQATPAPPPEDRPGIDYLALVEKAQRESLGEGSISYRELGLPGFPALAECETSAQETGVS